MEVKYFGIPASSGYVTGRVLCLNQKNIPTSSQNEQNMIPEQEIRRFMQARDAYLAFLDKLLESTNDGTDTESYEILDAHKELAADEELENDIVSHIRENSCSAETAVTNILNSVIQDMAEIEDEYARQRTDDIRQLRDKILGCLSELSSGVDRDPATSELSVPSTANGAPSPDIPDNFVLVGYDISPVDTLSLDLNRITGIVSECGGLTSHVAILAQTRGIPAVVSVSNFLNNIRNNDMICLDGRNGIVVIHPDDNTIKYYRQMAENELRERESNVGDTFPEPEPAFPVFANIGGLDDVEFALKYGAKGVGLFRTEFLLCDRELPDEETQFNIYCEVLERINGPVIVRTFDIGGDKLFFSLNLPAEPNPFLGNRGSRLYRDFPQLVQSQLRALLRASVYGDLRVMFPMIDTVEEVVFLKELVQQAREQLLNENVPLDEVPLGIMIETPAAVLIMNDLAPLVDFFSIGTNDLTQYTLAVDRGNKNVANLYNPFHPAVLQLIKMAIDTAHQYHKEIGMCGEFAGNPDAVPYLVDFGLDEWSVVPSKIPVIRERLRNCHL